MTAIGRWTASSTEREWRWKQSRFDGHAFPLRNPARKVRALPVPLSAGRLRQLRGLDPEDLPRARSVLFLSIMADQRALDALQRIETGLARDFNSIYRSAPRPVRSAEGPSSAAVGHE
jgi:hypothetical protein